LSRIKENELVLKFDSICLLGSWSLFC